MKVYDIQTTREDGSTTVSAEIHPDGAGASYRLWYRFEGLDLSAQNAGDAMAVGLLTPCMFEGEGLSIDAPLSETLCRNLPRAQEVLASWYDFMAPIKVTGSSLVATKPKPANPTGIACCFSAGVNSWYSLLKNQRWISHLLLVRGFDIGLDNDILWEESKSKISGIARRMGKKLIVCQTNLRELADKRRSKWGRVCTEDFWGQCLHGSALASVGLLLNSEIETLLVPSSHVYNRLRPWGSSPLLDQFWSNDDVEMVHDGCEASRLKKTSVLAACDLALETLRVCYYNTSAYNCCRCEKCLRTMLALRLCGAHTRAKTFREQIPISAIRNLAIPETGLQMYEELMFEAYRVNDRELAEALRIAVGHRFSVPRAYAQIRHAIRGSMLGPWLRPLVPLIEKSLLPPTRRRAG